MSGPAGGITSNTTSMSLRHKFNTHINPDWERGIVVAVDGAGNGKGVRISPALSKLNSEVLAAVERGVAGTAIEPVAAKRVNTEERLRASQEATNLTPEEKAKAAEIINKQIAELDMKLGSFKGTDAYNRFISAFAKYELK
ncbi:hypothetical protein GCM10011390_34120 [Aureimonas endophytica]|uniref:Uncharacterized protein n=1 Tax=Aureimonas endophytica TaxID=2027858 RepID=A0A917E8V5_9HYPH|nr:hypothetical protein [Aureimonas endophytica]GGE12134.1 hypothetical protein GCM10011390_34120 [Aureimonas endophytica]